MIKYAVFHPWRVAAILVIGVLLGYFGFYAYQLNALMGLVATESFDPGSARAAIAAAQDTDGAEVPTTTLGVAPAGLGFDPTAESMENLASRPPDFNLAAFGEPIPDSIFDAYLLIGSDASGYLADAIILALQPTDGSAPIMVSLPRDLYLWNACKQDFTRLNAGLGGCPGFASGSELMAIMVEDYTGIPVDHLARINFDGFAAVVNAMGGITVCVDNPTRDPKAGLDIPDAGCREADGQLALAWVRSRHMEQLIDGDWVVVSGSDFARQQRQQDALFQLAARAAGFSSPGALTERLSAVASSIRLDSGWSLGQAVATAWKYRGISKSSVRRFSIGVKDYTAPSGAQVLLPVVPFREELAKVYALG
ncbi:MAG: LCP family protein [Acidimicrobiia bacterium]